MPTRWPESTIVCLGGGPSLTQDDVDACRGRARVIAISDAYRLAPWADVLFSADARWWDWHDGAQSFEGMKYAVGSAGPQKYGVSVLRAAGEHGLARDPGAVATGRNSGYGAINLAVHLGAIKIILLGYDMQDHHGRSHWFGEHPDGGKPRYGTMLPGFDTLVKPLRTRGIDIVNCSRRTALKAFPRLPLSEALP